VPPVDKPLPANSTARDDPRAILEAYRDPVRGRVLIALSERPGVTIDEVAERLGGSPDQVGPHVEALLGAGLVEVTSEDEVNGETRRRYGRGPLDVFDGGPAGLEGSVEIGKATVRMLMGDFAIAAAAGTHSRRPDDFEVRTYGEVDEAYYRELVDQHWKAYREIRRSLDEGIARIGESGERGTEFVSALFFFEAPLWGPEAPRRAVRWPVDRSVDPDPRALAKACCHQVRWRILVALSERPDVTIRELADHLGEPRRRVRHHIETLVETGLAVVTSEDISRVVERRYAAGAIAADDLDSWDQEERLLFANSITRTLAADFSVAAAAGTLTRGGDDLQARMYGEVDDACLEELAELNLSIYRETRTMSEAGYERVMESGEPGIEVVTALFAFEVPLWRHVVRPPGRQAIA
jgi:DNA-binding transcriptional ArsR family regulator